MVDQDRRGADGRESKASTQPRQHRDAKVPPRSAKPPWRTEGLPQEPADDDRPRLPKWLKILGWVAAGYLMVFVLLTVQDQLGAPPTVSYTEFTDQVSSGNVKEIFAKGETIQGVLKAAQPLPGESDTTYREFQTERPTFAQDDLLTQLQGTGATVRATPVVTERGPLTNLLLSIAPFLLLAAFYVWLVRRQGQAMGAMFGGRKSKPVDPESVRVTFDDVAGIDEVKDEIFEIVDFLRDPSKYLSLGAHAPKGVLLTGPPGTGKTLLARATAGEAGVPFFSVSGSEFIEMIVGVGAQRVRALFDSARKVAPSIVFIDEIDTIGRSRGGAYSVSGHDEREQTLNQVLTEMDGFTGSEGVIVLAATNRAEVLDPALLRAGRFDRQIVLHPPDRKGRLDILKVHTRSTPLAADADLDQVARTTPGMTGADLANLVNEAALLAARRKLSKVGAREFSDALEKVLLGTARRVVLSEEDRTRTAYHESGHALLGMIQPGADPVRKVSIIPRDRSLGATLSTPESDRYGYNEGYLRGRIIGALGGMAAEKVVFGEVTTGAENDLEIVTRIARSMVGRWGMSAEIGPVSVLPPDGSNARMAGTSDALLDAVDEEVRRITDECYAEAQSQLREHRDRLDSIAKRLLEAETLEEDEVYAAAGIARGRPTGSAR